MQGRWHQPDIPTPLHGAAPPSHRPAAHSRRNRLPAPVLIAAAIALASASARAQLLDLDSASPLKPGDGKGALTLAERIDADLNERGRRGEADVPGSPLHTRWSLALRRMIRDTLRAGENAGEVGSWHIVAARSLHARLHELDNLALAPRNPSTTDHRTSTAHPAALDPALTLTIEAALAELSTLRDSNPDSRATIRIPPTAEQLDRLFRNVLGPVAQHEWDSGSTGDTATLGWIWLNPADTTFETEPLDALLTAVRGRPGIRDEALDSLASFDRTLELGSQWWTHRRTGAAYRRSLDHAVLRDDTAPAWMAPPTRERLNELWSRAAHRIASAATREDALRELDRLARLVDVIRTVDAVSLHPPRASPSGRDDAADAARQVVIDAVERAVANPDQSSEPLRALGRVLLLIDERATLGDESGVARELRPAWRALDPIAAKTESDLFRMLPAVGSRDDAMMNPATIGAIAAHRRSLDDLRMLRSISRWLGEAYPDDRTPDPDASARLTAQGRLAAARALTLSKQLANDQQRPAALAALRSLADDLDSFMQLPGEAALRAANEPAWDLFTGGPAARASLARAVDAERARWLETWAKLGAATRGNDQIDDREVDAAQSRHRMRTLRDLLSWCDNAATVQRIIWQLEVIERDRAAQPNEHAPTTPGAPSSSSPGRAAPPAPSPKLPSHRGIQWWPGWELSSSAAASLIHSLDATLAEAVRSIIESDGRVPVHDAARKTCDQLALTRHAASLLAELDRQALARDLRRTHVVMELAAPMPPRGSWLSEHRADLAAICRYAEEFAWARHEGETTWAARIQRVMNERAKAVLNSLGSSR